MAQIRSRAWCITWNNPTRTEYRIMDTVACQYIVWQDESGGRRGTPHIQGYVYFKSAKTFERVKKLFPGAHLEKAAGSPQQNKTYCQKEDTRADKGKNGERGIIPIQGSRVDIEEMQKDIKEGMNDRDMFEKYPTGWAQYERVLTKYRSNLKRKRREWTITHVLWGPTDTGKSHKAHQLAEIKDDDYGVLMIQEKGRPIWADGTEQSTAIVIEDFAGEIPYRALLQMLDKWPCRVPIKGGSMEWSPKHIYITSNLHPRDWYVHMQNDQNGYTWVQDPLYRRLTTGGSKIENLTKVYVPPIAFLTDLRVPKMLRRYGDAFTEENTSDTDLDIMDPDF